MKRLVVCLAIVSIMLLAGCAAEQQAPADPVEEESVRPQAPPSSAMEESQHLDDVVQSEALESSQPRPVPTPRKLTADNVYGDWVGHKTCYLIAEDGRYWSYAPGEWWGAPPQYLSGKWEMVDTQLRLWATKQIYLVENSADPTDYSYEVIEYHIPQEMPVGAKFNHRDELLLGGSGHEQASAEKPVPEALAAIRQRDLLSEMPAQTVRYDLPEMLDSAADTEYYIEYLRFWDDDTVLFAGRDADNFFASYNLSTGELYNFRAERPLGFRYETDRFLLFRESELEIYSLPGYELQMVLPLPQELQDGRSRYQFALSPDSTLLAFDGPRGGEGGAPYLGFYDFASAQWTVKPSLECPLEDASKLESWLSDLYFVDDATVVFSQVWSYPAGEWVEMASAVAFCSPDTDPVAIVTPYHASKVIAAGQRLLFTASPGPYTSADDTEIYAINSDTQEGFESLALTNQVIVGDNHTGNLLVVLQRNVEPEGPYAGWNRATVYDSATLAPVRERYIGIPHENEGVYWGYGDAKKLSVSPNGRKILYVPQDGEGPSFCVKAWDE